MSRLFFPRLLGLCLLALNLLVGTFTPSTAEAAHFEIGETIEVKDTQEEDLWLLGGKIDVSGMVDGEVWIAGGEIEISAPIDGELWVVGGIITLKGAVDDEVRLFGGEIYFDGAATGEVVVAGGRIEFSKTSALREELAVYGETIELDGTFSDDVMAIGNEIAIAGTYVADVTLRGEKIKIARGTRVVGSLEIFADEEPTLPEGFVAGGSYRFEHIDADDLADLDFDNVGPLGPIVLVAGVGAFISIIITFFVFFIGILVILISPETPQRTAEQIRNEPVKAGLTGLAAIVVIPIIFGILIATLVGIPIAIVVILLYLLLLLLGYLCSAYTIAALAFERTGQTLSFGMRLSYIVVGLVALYAAGLVPVVGEITIAVALAFGVGGLTLVIFSGRRPKIAFDG